MKLTRIFLICFSVAVALLSCTPPVTHQASYYPICTDFCKEYSLFNSSGQKVDPFDETFDWDNVYSIILNGKRIEVPKQPDVDRLRGTERPDLLNLPVGAKTELIYGWQAVNLPDGNVLISGGEEVGRNANPLDSIWLLSNATGTVQLEAHMHVGRVNHSMTILRDGNVLISGGEPKNTKRPDSSCELYNHSTHISSMLCNLGIPRFKHSSVQLANGNVLVVGGATLPEYADESDDLIAGIQILIIDKKSCQSIGRMEFAREYPSVLPLGYDQAVIFGGQGDGPPIPMLHIERLKPDVAG